jgi:hypothetical protein
MYLRLTVCWVDEVLSPQEHNSTASSSMMLLRGMRFFTDDPSNLEEA